jgi:Zn-dependent peptidase ImmA (M78 family)
MVSADQSGATVSAANAKGVRPDGSAFSQADYDRMDAEANAFAMELLMPEKWIRRDAAGIDICDDAAIAKLAKRYQVPASAMAIRIGQVLS